MLPSDETCFRTQAEAEEFALAPDPRLRTVFSQGIIGIHYEGRDFTGASLTLSGTDCAGGGITLTGGVWDNRIRSTRNGCSRIEHYLEACHIA